jgi:hypothetical protein
MRRHRVRTGDIIGFEGMPQGIVLSVVKGLITLNTGETGTYDNIYIHAREYDDIPDGDYGPYKILYRNSAW